MLSKTMLCLSSGNTNFGGFLSNNLDLSGTIPTLIPISPTAASPQYKPKLHAAIKMTSVDDKSPGEKPSATPGQSRQSLSHS